MTCVAVQGCPVGASAASIAPANAVSHDSPHAITGTPSISTRPPSRFTFAAICVPPPVIVAVCLTLAPSLGEPKTCARTNAAGTDASVSTYFMGS